MSKTYVITGATSGIGNALVREFSEDNIVFAGYRNEKSVEDLISISKNVIPFYIDFGMTDTISSAVKFICSKTDKIDTLINAAGCVVAGAMEEIDAENIRYQFNINTFGHVEFSQNFLKNGVLNGGRIINISSMSSFGIFPFVSPYCASKRALDILFNAILMENNDNNVKIISIKPGVIATPLWDKSVSVNSKLLNSDSKYKNIYDYLMKNAQKNGKYGLSVNEVVKVIKKADSSKNPKLSYTVGFDAKFAEIFSHLPQSIINKCVRFALSLRMR